jgi:hypothetical protein
MIPVPRRRGQPLALLALVVVGWAAMRAVVWESPFGPVADLMPPVVLADARSPPPPATTAPLPLPAKDDTFRDRGSPALAAVGRDVGSSRFDVTPLPGPQPALPLASSPREPLPRLTPAVAAGHQLLYLAALGRLPLPQTLAASLRSAEVPAAGAGPLQRGIAPSAAVFRPARWSGDGWLLWRDRSRGLTAAAGAPAYGSSQAGAVLRYALAPGSERAPQAQLRLSRSLGSIAEAEAAVGLSARPLAVLPVRLLAEARVQRSGGRTRLRPATSLISELPPIGLPLQIEGEAYVQAGYVGGRNGTAFVDAQASAERRLIDRGPAELRLGAGAWVGGQEGARRLDIGPRASLRLKLGETRSRVALDWRFRVAGNARPASGPALTVSAGF